MQAKAALTLVAWQRGHLRIPRSAVPFICCRPCLAQNRFLSRFGWTGRRSACGPTLPLTCTEVPRRFSCTQIHPRSTAECQVPAALTLRLPPKQPAQSSSSTLLDAAANWRLILSPVFLSPNWISTWALGFEYSSSLSTPSFSSLSRSCQSASSTVLESCQV